MNIMIASAVTTYYSKEEKAFTEALQKCLTEQSHTADSFYIPVAHELLSLPEQFFLTRLLDISQSADLLITIGYPAFAIPYHNKLAVLFSMVPELYEGWDTEYGVLGSPQYASIRSSLYTSERKCLEEAKKIYCVSDIMAKDIKQRYAIDTETIQIPCLYPYSNNNLPEIDSNYILCETELQPAARIDLLLEAVQLSNHNWKLLLAIPSADETYMSALYERIQVLNIKDRVAIHIGVLSQSVIRNAIAYSCITFASRKFPNAFLAAMKNGVPVLTANDSGCLAEYINHENNGIIVQPNAKEISEAVATLITNRRLKKRLSDECKIHADNAGDIKYIAKRLVENA
jgi:glycosyltransferase involved in cell wall biosynthesis